MTPRMIDLGHAMARVEDAEDGEPILTICWPDDPPVVCTIHSRASLTALIEGLLGALEEKANGD